MGVEIRTGMTFGKDVTFDSLKKEGYKAFFLATGLHQNIRLNVANEDLNGILHGIDFLRDISLKNPVPLGRKVIIVGGGNVAMDVSMTAIRQGGAEVTLVSLEQRDEMPAWEREINEAIEEGIKFVHGLGPNRFLDKEGRVSGIEFKRCTSVFDADGTFSPQYDEADLTTLEVDTVIIAIGQTADSVFAEQQGLTATGEGLIKVDPITLETSIRGVFAGGDVYYGPQTVVEAIGSGKEASVSIDRYLRGLDLYTGREARDAKLTSITEPVKDTYDPTPRADIVWLPVEERMGLDEVQLGLSEKTALQEAKRCITCGTSCVQACPYGVMQFNQDVLKAVKCDLCVEKRGRGEAPACTWSCPAHCIHWGDDSTFPAGVNDGLQRIVP